MERAICFGLAVGGTIAPRSVFARKNYFYPDLPKGYQISQYELPVVSGGALDIVVGESEKRVRLTRVGGEKVASLSHGQQRQLEVGMALAGAPRLILFDEPAAGLSPAERRELVALLAALPAHMSFILIEHDLEIALRVVDRVTVMHNGRVLKEGTPGEIENDPEVQEIYMGRAGHA